MEFSRQQYWNGLLCPPRGDLPNPGMEPRSPALQADALPTEPPGKVGVCISSSLRTPLLLIPNSEAQSFWESGKDRGRVWGSAKGWSFGINLFIDAASSDVISAPLTLAPPGFGI